VNVVKDKKYKKITAEMHKKMLAFFKAQIK